MTYDWYRYNTRTQQTNILINKTKDESTMPQGSQHHHTGRKRTKDRDADKNATRLVADVDEFADLDEKYQPTLNMEINNKCRKDYRNRKIVKYLEKEKPHYYEIGERYQMMLI